jgi:hypothetical protein
MKIISYVPLTPAQIRFFDDLEHAEVRAALIAPDVVATIKTFQGQQIQLAIDESGVIKHLELID